MVMPIGNLDEACVFGLCPAMAKVLVPLLFSVPIAANQSAPLQKDLRNIGQGLHIVDGGRLSRDRKIAGKGAGVAAGRAGLRSWVYQGGFLTADKGAGADAGYPTSKSKPFAEDVFLPKKPQPAGFAGWPFAGVQPLPDIPPDT